MVTPSPISVPLQARVPNPPRLFVGREAEAAALAQVLSAGPVAVVEGAQGLGKTSLVAHTLRAQPALEARTIQLNVARAGGLFPWLEALREALCAATGQRPPVPDGGVVPWTVEALRLAERAALAVVADDTGEVADDALCPVVEILARHARASRWVFVRHQPLPLLALLEQTVSVGPLDDAAMLELAHGLAVGGSPLPTAEIAACGGSPLRLRQAVLAARMAPAKATARRVLAVSRSPMPVQQLQGMTGLDAAEIDALAEGGAAERVGDLVGLTERSRAEVLADASADELSVHRDALLAAAIPDDPADLLERIRLLGEAGRVQALDDLLRTRLLALVDAGRCASLWAVLAPHVTHPALQPHGLALAALSRSDPSLLQWALDQPEPEAPVARWRWAQALFHAGQRVRARDTLRTLAPAGLGPYAVEAAVNRAEMELRTGDRAGAEAALSAVEATAQSPQDRARLAAMWVTLHATTLNYAAADAAMGTLQTAWAQTPANAQRAAFDEYASAALYLGRNAAVFEAAQAVLGTDALDHGPLTLRSTLLVALTRDLRLAAVQALCAGRAALREQPHVVDRVFTYCGAVAALHRGQIAQARVALHGPSDGEAPLIRLQGLRAELAGWEGQPTATEPTARAPNAPAGLITALMVERERLRAELRPPALTPPPGVEANVFLHGQYALNAAVHKLVTGDLAAAAQMLAVVAERAERHRTRLLAATAAELGADGAWLQGDRLAHRRWIDALDGLAQHAPSDRLAAIARFHRALTPFDPAALAALARQAAVAPRVARRAQALLGGLAPLDRLDRAVLALLPHPTWTNRGADEPWSPGWGASATARQVWLPDGATHSVGPRSNHLAVLGVLAAAGGAADKDALVEALWGDAYDPRIHDRRIYMAVNRLRQRLGDDAGEPRMVITTPDGGYAIGRGLRFVWFA